ncbi:MAG: hypothetical protein KC561_12825, partial [Myxococcales bacterium]|nr:hypothetical protein [Myxococcales bacterium]
MTTVANETNGDNAVTIQTEAWVIHEGEGDNPGPTKLVREEWQLNEPGPEQVLVTPLYGCWEGNMGHALERQPVDICKQRGEKRVVFGNAGVVRVERVGAEVTTVKPGDNAILFCNGIPDKYGYPKRIFGYDAPGTVGLLARKTVLEQHQVIPIPADTQYSLPAWAAF